jgi:hypothetical protein
MSETDDLISQSKAIIESCRVSKVRRRRRQVADCDAERIAISAKRVALSEELLKRTNHLEGR